MSEILNKGNSELEKQEVKHSYPWDTLLNLGPEGFLVVHGTDIEVVWCVKTRRWWTRDAHTLGLNLSSNLSAEEERKLEEVFLS